MSRGWKRTDLVMGEDLVLPDSFFEMPSVAKQRMEYCVYAGETETGIIVEIQYKPSHFSEDPESSWRVQKFIDFGAIYSGLQIRRRDRSLVTARRKRELIVEPRRKSYEWRNKEAQRY